MGDTILRMKCKHTLISTHRDLPTSSSSFSLAPLLYFFQMSMVKRVLLLLKMEVSDDIKAAIITAIINPRSPGTHTLTITWFLGLKDCGMGSFTFAKVMLTVQTYTQFGKHKILILITAGHELDDQFWISKVGTSHLCTTHLYTLFRVHTSHCVWKKEHVHK